MIMSQVHSLYIVGLIGIFFILVPKVNSGECSWVEMQSTELKVIILEALKLESSIQF